MVVVPARRRSSLGQVVRRTGGQVVRWSGGQVARWPGGQGVRWSGGQVFRWPGGQMARRPGVHLGAEVGLCVGQACWMETPVTRSGLARATVRWPWAPSIAQHCPDSTPAWSTNIWRKIKI